MPLAGVPTCVGTDFRDLSLIEVEFTADSVDPKMSVERLIIDSSVPEDPAAKAVSVTCRLCAGSGIEEGVEDMHS